MRGSADFRAQKKNSVSRRAVCSFVHTEEERRAEWGGLKAVVLVVCCAGYVVEGFLRMEKCDWERSDGMLMGSSHGAVLFMDFTGRVERRFGEPLLERITDGAFGITPGSV